MNGYFFFTIWGLQPFEEYFTNVKQIIQQWWVETGAP